MTRRKTNNAALAARLLRDNRGSQAVEMALVFPFLAMMILGAIEIGWMLWSASTLYFAVEEAARCGAVDLDNCGSTSAIQAVAVSKAMGLSMTASNFTVSTPACGQKVSATYTFNFVVPFYPGFHVAIPATSCYPVQPSLSS
jgi:Flp pilus assembly protein TadG